MWAFYPPVILWILLLSIRYCGIRQLTASNPSMKTGGLIDSDKAKNLLEIQSKLPNAVAKTKLVPAPTESVDRAAILTDAMEELGLRYPIILKPNSGQRGLGVAVIKDRNEATAYLDRNGREILIQEYVEGAEFGVFYMREPSKPNGFIFSITHKQFPQLVGDGTSTLEQLILEDDRALYMARFLLERHSDQLSRVMKIGERLTLVEIGSHSRGSLFVDGSAYLTPELQNRIDEISKTIPEYYFGRYDLRVPSIDHLMRGEELKIIEANGLTSESTNIYDPKNSLLFAYKTLFRQWNMAFKISRQNYRNGAKITSYRELLSTLQTMNR